MRNNKSERTEGKDHMKRRKKKAGRNGRAVLQVLQHLLLVIAVVATLIVTTGSTVVIQGLHGSENYNLHASDKEETYEIGRAS